MRLKKWYEIIVEGGYIMFINQDNIDVELDRKCCNVNDLIDEVVRKLELDQKKCIVKSKSAMPIINVDGIDYWISIGSVFGRYIGIQKAILKKLK